MQTVETRIGTFTFPVPLAQACSQRLRTATLAEIALLLSQFEGAALPLRNEEIYHRVRRRPAFLPLMDLLSQGIVTNHSMRRGHIKPGKHATVQAHPGNWSVTEKNTLDSLRVLDGLPGEEQFNSRREVLLSGELEALTEMARFVANERGYLFDPTNSPLLLGLLRSRKALQQLIEFTHGWISDKGIPLSADMPLVYGDYYVLLRKADGPPWVPLYRDSDKCVTLRDQRAHLLIEAKSARWIKSNARSVVTFKP